MPTPIPIEYLIKRFYQRVTSDVLIGFLFAHLGNFEDHIPRIIIFWKQQLGLPLSTEEKELNIVFELLKSHRQLPFPLKKTYINRWVKIFNQTIEEVEQLHPRLDQEVYWSLLKQKVVHFHKIFNHAF
jgi:truncated hemoglobin YjbI